MAGAGGVTRAFLLAFALALARGLSAFADPCVKRGVAERQRFATGAS
ncbi:hypothetical protein K788_0007785 [Paraburkholderia caribensis MBA4]|uniref:Uncharacterized protein n=1 Tax=Paraburkholderia caribensis MBA4 TaxID=1323664 RepID=A0A0P0R6P2_9BURK|nr:hypothetical protein K788_0007785 [Paraburkholderia caribensis MBA4]